jgi:Outer membrane protein beta-barrel domain
MRFVVALAMGLAVAPAAAQEPPFRFEITPYAAYRVGGEFEPQEAEPKAAGGFELHEGNAEGLILDIRTSEGNGQWELLYAHQATELDTQPSFVGGPTLDLDVSHYQFGGTYLFTVDADAIAPFISMTAGLARFEPRLDGVDAENYFSWSLGGGVHLRADKRVGVRLEARAYSTIIDGDSALFCVFSPTVNSCAVFVEGDQLYQFEARVGIVTRF